MPPPTLPVTAAELAVAMDLPSPLSSGHRGLLEAAILDAVADVEAYLGRAVLPQTFTEQHRWETAFGFSVTPLDEPVIEIVSAVAETAGDPPLPTGYFTVTYRAGLDCRDPDKRPILRYIKAAAMNAPEVTRLWQSVTGQRGQITNVSTDGQSVSYAPATLGGGGVAGSGLPGALPALGSLDRWRRAGRRVFTRKGTVPGEPWPYEAAAWSSPWW